MEYGVCRVELNTTSLGLNEKSFFEEYYGHHGSFVESNTGMAFIYLLVYPRDGIEQEQEAGQTGSTNGLKPPSPGFGFLKMCADFNHLRLIDT